MTLFAPAVPNGTSFFLRFIFDMSQLRDAAGRPLHEVDFRGELSSDVIVRCPYPGSRHNLKMNKSALRLIGRHWSDIENSFEALKGVCDLESAGAESIWQRSLVPMFLPMYLSRKHGRLGGELPVMPMLVSDLFKVMLDVPTTVDLMMIRMASQRITMSITGDNIVAFAEEVGALVNGDWVCAGPDATMRQLAKRCVVDDKNEDIKDGHRILDLIGEDFGSFVKVASHQYALSQALQVTTSFLMEAAFRNLYTKGGPMHMSSSPVEPSAYETRRRYILANCETPTQADLILLTFSELAGEFDSTKQLLNDMRRAVASAHNLKAAALLEVQRNLEHSFFFATSELQGAAHKCLKPAAPPWESDFSCFEASVFPTQILSAVLDGSWHGTIPRAGEKGLPESEEVPASR